MHEKGLGFKGIVRREEEEKRSSSRREEDEERRLSRREEDEERRLSKDLKRQALVREEGVVMRNRGYHAECK